MRRAPASALLLSFAALGLAQSSVQGPALPRASSVVEPRALISLDRVPRGRSFELAVIAKIRPGFHINAHEVTLEYLIPTALQIELPPGFQAAETVYPPGMLRKLKFSSEKLSVYEGSVTLRMRLQALPDAPLGTRRLALRLHYQACTDEACLPPVQLPFIAEFEVAPVNTPARPANRAVFQTPPQTKKQPPR